MRAAAERVGRRSSARGVAVLLARLAVSLGTMWAVAVLRYAVAGEVPVGSSAVESDAVIQVGAALDLGLLVPSYAVGAVLLWRREVWGTMVAAVVLVSGVLHQVSYLVSLPFQVAADVPGAVGFDPVEPVIVAVFVAGTWLLLGPRRRSGAEAA